MYKKPARGWSRYRIVFVVTITLLILSVFASVFLPPTAAAFRHRKSRILAVRVFLDEECNGYFNYRSDTRLRGVPITVTFPDGSTRTRTTGRFGFVIFGRLDVSEGITVQVELPPTYEGELLENCPDSPTLIELQPSDFRFKFKYVRFRATRVVDQLPPDPTTVAPPVDPTVATTIAAATEFLHTGDDPIQTGVVPGTIKTKRAAVLGGRVLTQEGEPLPGVDITIHNHPEFGSTLSRIDGAFDMAVNGGSHLIVRYEADGYLPAQRGTEVPWQDYTHLPDVRLLAPDLNVSIVDFSEGAPAQIAQGSRVADDDGERQAVLFFPEGGNMVNMELSDGTILPAQASLSVRLTEYTVGTEGPSSMPAELPPMSGYTYAVDLNADEAVAAGAKKVTFDPSLSFYVENFLDFPVGGLVPVGYYDFDKGHWIPSDNGRVIEVVDIVGGDATVDVDGDGAADDPDALAELGITDAEREQLAGLYSPGQSLWRVPITHFTPVDINWPVGPPEDADPPMQEDPFEDDKVDCPIEAPGSTIECQNQILGETVDITGTSLTLNYRSDRTLGRVASRTLEIPLSGDALPSSLKNIEVEVAVAGREISERFPAEPNRTYLFTWDGRDAYGRLVQGGQHTSIRIGYVYDAVYQVPAQVGPAFGALSGVPLADNQARQEIQLSQRWSKQIEVWDVRAQGLGAWTLDIHHSYDPLQSVLYRGDGGRRSVEGRGSVINVTAGTGVAGFSGEGGPATLANLYKPTGVSLGSDGSLYIADKGNNRVRRVGPDGIISTVAGTGNSGFSGEGGPATLAELNEPSGVAVRSDGSLYIADQNNNRIRRVAPDGIITTVAGTGESGHSGDGGPAIMAKLDEPSEVAVGTDGSFYIADIFNSRIRRVGPDGIITTLAGNGSGGGGGAAFISSALGQGDGGPANLADLNRPSGVAVGPDGSLYIADSYDYRIRRIGQNGIITSSVGSGDWGFSGDGGPATTADLAEPSSVAVDADGSLFVADTSNQRIRHVGPDGIITTLAGSDGGGGYGGFAGTFGLLSAVGSEDGGPATQASLTYPEAVAVGADGSLYIADTGNNQIRRVQPPLPGLSSTEFYVPSDSATEIYVFESTGRHLQTLNALTGAVLYEFVYDNEGLLVEIRDNDDNVTTIERDSEGIATEIVAPFGQRTVLTISTEGYLTSVTNPAGEATEFSYTSDGLLTGMTDPNNNKYAYSYDSLGRLIRDDDPAGGFQTLSRENTNDGHEVTKVTAEGRVTTYGVEDLSTGDRRLVNTFPDGTQSVTLIGTDGSVNVTHPDGTENDTLQGPDPRFGMQAPIPVTETVTTPAWRRRTFESNRIVDLADSNDPLSFTNITDTFEINSRIYKSVFDAASNTFTDTTPEGRQSTMTIDSQGRPVRQKLADFLPIDYSYDSFGRLITITQGSGSEARTTTNAYNSDGYLESVTDPLGQVTRFSYDQTGRVTSKTLPDGQIIQLGYDANGNITSITPPGQPSHTFSYTSVNQKDEYTPPDVGAGTNSTLYSYNLDRQLSSVTRPDDQTLEFTYDSAGRLSKQTLSRGEILYNYDASTGQLIMTTAPDGGTITYSYDGSLLIGETWTGDVEGRLTYRYNNDFRVSNLTIGGANTFSFGYDADGLLVRAGNLYLTRAPDNGLLLAATLGNMDDSWGYSDYGELTNITSRYNGSAIFTVDYERDRLGRITRRTETVEAQTDTYEYVYDAVGQLVEVVESGVTIAIYSYDANGNRLSHTGPDGTFSGSYDDQDRLLEYGSTNYEYAASGELLSKTIAGQTTTYQYDVLGNLMAVTLPDGTEIEYVIDGSNRRIGKKINGTLVQAFLYQDELNPVAELDGDSNVVSVFVFGSRDNVPEYVVSRKEDGITWETYRIVSDHLGSTRLVVNIATGDVVQRLDYDEFGNVILASESGFQPFGFAGGLYDTDTGLVRFGVRDYDASTGRWTTKEPLLVATQSFNLYSYVGNDPLNTTDPNGLLSKTAIVLIAALLTGGPAVPPLIAATNPQIAKEAVELFTNVHEAAKGLAKARADFQKACGRAQKAITRQAKSQRFRLYMRALWRGALRASALIRVYFGGPLILWVPPGQGSFPIEA